MNIFQKVKERVTARQVAEKYGLKVRQNGMACCPFHNDKHPSMKIDRNYYCDIVSPVEQKAMDRILEEILQTGICGRGMASIICRSLTE